ncbi:FAD-dependent oxidoreductase [Ferrovibrio terrae]|uniref:FAD-dependent oxidoreductase n=1 Tax=Ferrovibrio terrae TaxID=2594003 RepID=A0A516GZN9_9PROT|nr:FAD-dependent oxidoreductase [Ferrovibrio terrae]QDO96983.1 FAD-dependent oxidoreductase [Ferrovibrio terrae]
MKTYECDLLVVGSGAGGMAAAITAKLHGLNVLVVEKEAVYGGTTARSGGWLWIPGNPLAAREGFKDSKEQGRTYLQAEAGNHFDAARVDAFLDNGPQMVEFFESKTDVQFVLGPQFSDYHPNQPGALTGGRSICAAPYDGRELGAQIKTLRPPLEEITFVGMMIGSGKELLHFFNVTRSVVSAAYVAKLLAKYLRDLALHGRGMRLTNGNALAGRLAKSATDLGIPLWLNAPAGELLREGDSVTGAIINTKDGAVEVRATKGVVLATGGFPHDIARRAKLYPHAPSGHEHWSPATESNTGDGIKLAMKAVGATTADELPNAAAWVPVSRPRRSDGTPGTFPHFIDRAKPGVIAVTNAGRRFVNEGDCYHDFCQALVKATKNLPGEICAWLVADHPTLRRYGLGHVKPFPVPLAHQLRSGYLKRGRTLAELAAECGVDAAEFERTVASYNRHAERGEDPEFHKGSTAYNRYLGDPSVTPNPCLAPIQTGPFYAVQVVIGDLGSFAGLKTDAQARVLDGEGRPVPGLYAAGNDMASIMGGNYPGGGITLGPAMTFGYIAGRHAAGVA